MSMQDITARLKARFGDRLKQSEPMAKHTNFRIGGEARWFLEVKTEGELRDAVSIAKEGGARIVIHGGGSNVLYADGPINALILVPAFREIEIESESDGESPANQPLVAGEQSPPKFGTAGSPNLTAIAPEGFGGHRKSGAGDVVQDGLRIRVTARAGVLSAMLARKTAEAGLAGLTWMISLPGTVGGAVRGNAGCFGGEMSDHLVSVRVLCHSDLAEESLAQRKKIWEIVELDREALKMSYRHSILKEEKGKDWIILSATFELEAGDRETLKTELETTMKKRKASQPQNAGCAGCIFKNYEIESDEELERLKSKLKIPEAMLSSRRLSAGWIIEELGLKGFAIGGAKVSEMHANFLVSEQAVSDEIMQLIAVIKTRARDQFGIQLQEEIQFVR